MNITKFIPLFLLTLTNAVFASNKNVVITKKTGAAAFFQSNKTLIMIVLGVIIIGGIAYFWTRNKNK